MSSGENFEARPSLIYLEGTSDPGPRQLGPYRVIARFSGSGMTDVYLGQKKTAFGFVRLVVIKHVPRGTPQYDLRRQMLFDEARALAYLDHPNLVTLLDAEEDSTGVYLCLEFVDGTDLRSVNASLRARGEALPFELAGFIAVEVLRGLHHAHTAERPDGSSLRMVHRDVNPANILVSRTGHLKLTDFGVVHMQDRMQAPTEPGLVKGKFSYLAPEYIQGRPVDPRMDTYSVGVVLFELLTGRPLFSGETAHDIMRKIVAHEIRLDRLEREGVPEPLRVIVERSLAREPIHRFTTAEDMANALETWLIKSELHASPWILSAFFRQHQLFGPSARISGPAAALGHAGIPTASSAPGSRPFTAHTDAAPPFSDEHVTMREARLAPASTAPVVETIEPITSPGTPIPPAATQRSGPPAFSTPPAGSPIPGGSQPPARVFPSFSQPPQRAPDNAPTVTGAPNPLRAPKVPSLASRPPIAAASTPPGMIDFESNEPTDRGTPMASSLPPFLPQAVDVPVSEPPIAVRPTQPQAAPSSHAPSHLHHPNVHPAAPPKEQAHHDIVNPGRLGSTPPARIGPGAASGTFSEAAPAVVLARLLGSQASGTLEFRSGLIWKRIALHDGQVLNASSNMGMEDLGEQLVRARVVKRADLDRALRESRGSEIAAWHRLLEIQAVTREALAKQLGQSITHALEDLLGWEDGTFEFTPGSPELPPVIPAVDLGKLISRAPGSGSSRRASHPAPPPRQASTPGDSLPPRKRPSLSEALGLARQAQEGSTNGRGSNPPNKD